jgi:dipeptidyl aminopeptidase/acylaminoacyl peptidase
MTELSLADVLDVEYPGRPAWADDAVHLAALVYEDDGRALLVGTQGANGTAAGDGSSRRYRPGAGHVTDFAWRPGATEVAVTTDEDELHLVDVGPDERRLVAADPAGISEPAWGPEGDRLAYYCGGRPAVWSAATGATVGFDVPANDRFLPGGRMLAWDRPGERLAFVFVDRDTTQVGVVDAETGTLEWRTTDLAATGAPAWLADGRLLVVRRRERGTVREVVAVAPDGGAETVLFEERDEDRGAVSRGVPEVSPDGTTVAVVLPLDGWDHVSVHDVEAGATSQLTGGAFEDRGVADGTPDWVDDGTLVFASNRRDPGQRQLFAVDVASGDVSSVVEDPGTSVHPVASPTGEHVAYVHANRQRSPELRVSRLDAGDPGGGPVGSTVRLSESAVDGWPVDPIDPEPVSFESHDGLEIRGYMLDPRGDGVDSDGTDLPALVWVHGGPMRQMRDGWHPSRAYGLAYTVHQYLARHGYVGLLVNYRGGIGYGREFRQALADDYGHDEMGDVVAAADYLRDREFVDADHIGIWGLSYGGYATLQILGTDPDAFDLGISLAGLADLERHYDWAYETKYPAVSAPEEVVFGGSPWDTPKEWDGASPLTHVESYDAPLYTFHGTDDSYVHVDQQDRLVDRLLDLDGEFEAEYYPDEGHVFRRRSVWRRTLRKIETALDRHL